MGRWKKRTEMPADMMLPGERWREVVGYEGEYDVSDQGRVWSRKGNGRVMRGGVNGGGYLMVTLCVVGHRYALATVHTLVAVAFIGPRPDGLQVDHSDGVKTNNRLSNLSYVTARENARNSVRNGNISRVRKLTYNQAEEMRCRAKAGETVASLAREYGIVYHAARRVVSGKTYTHRICQHPPRRKLTDAQAAEIRARCAAGELQSVVGREFGVSQGSVSQIVRDISYRTTERPITPEVA